MYSATVLNQAAASVQCPAAKPYAIGGGGSTNLANRNIEHSEPINAAGVVPANGSPATGWRVTVSGNNNVDTTVNVICAA